MKRFAPFIIIALVALLTVGLATMFYRAKTRPVPAAAAGATPAPPEEKEDESLHVRGSRKAPVTLEIYGDFQCPSCATAAGVIGELEQQYGNRLQVIFHEFPLAMHNHAVEAAMAAEAAGLQGKFWEMHDVLYKNQSVWSRVSTVQTFFAAYANSIGLDVARFEEDRKSPALQARVVAEGDAGVARGVKNTPTLFVNGTEVRTVFDKEKLQEAIETALAGKKNS